ncbi:MAG TPA: hypothetical protein VI408_03770 [Gaiellaceae bacterium]
MRPKAALLAVLTVAVLGLAASAAHGTSGGYTAMTKADLTIHHSMFGCHTWTLNGNESLVQHIVIRAGRSFTLRNHDNCPHNLVETSGTGNIMMSSATDGAIRDGNLVPFQTALRVNLFTPGTYSFTTEEGVIEQDQPLSGFFRMPSYGPDNQLKLDVTVLPPAKIDE